jgi:hypothetical protein
MSQQSASTPVTTPRPGAVRAVPRQYSRIGWDYLKPRIGRMMDAADDRFFEMAGKTSSGRDQRNFFEAMRLVRLKRSDYEAAWHALWLAAASGGDTALKSRGGDDSDFALLDKDEHEEEVALHSMSARAEEVFTRPLADLRLRIGKLPSPECDAGNPFTPPVLCELCRQATQTFEISIEARLVLYKLFERFVIQDLAQLYRECLAAFARVGIRDTAETPGRRRQRGATAAGSAAAQTREASAQNDGTFDQLVGLLRQAAGGGGGQFAGGAVASGVAGAQGTAPGPVLSQADLVTALTAMPEVGALMPQAGGSRTSLREVVLSNPALAGRQPGQSESDTLTLVSMLFDVILEDQRLAAPMRAQIARLQIPILKRALQDTSFFSNSRHPIRLLLNEIFRAVVGWVPGDDVEQDPLYQAVSGVVEQILSGEDPDFHQLLDEFRGFTERERRRAELLQQRLEEAARAKAKTKHARQITRQFIADLIGERRLTPAMDALLRQGLQRALYMANLREGDGGPSWSPLAQLGEDVLRWFDEGRDPDVAAILSDRARDALVNAGIDASRTEEMLQALAAPRMEVVAGSADDEERGPDHRVSAVDDILATPPEAAPAPVQPPELEDEDEEPADVQAEQPDPEPTYLDMTARLSRGSWIELVGEDGRPQRCRLAIVLDATSSFLFVTRTGQRALECTRRQLARMIQDGQVKLLDDRELFETALETVIGNLRSGRAA